MRRTTKLSGPSINERESTCPPIGLVILAAGASTRLGRPKQLLNYKERSLLRGAAISALGSVCDPIAVVLGACVEQLVDEFSDEPRVNIVINPQWEKGMGSSIRVGIQALEADTSRVPRIEGAVILLCDQPFVTAQIVNELVAGYRATGLPIIASEYGGTLGAPVLFSRALFSELTSLNGAEGAKKVIKEHPGEVFRMPFAQGSIDIDTKADYEHLLAMADRPGPNPLTHGIPIGKVNATRCAPDLYPVTPDESRRDVL